MNNLADPNHLYAFIEEAAKLFSRGYRVYIEYPISLLEGCKAVVDIYAVRGDEEVIVEVGTLSPRRGLNEWKKNHVERIDGLKRAKPKATIVWITQWKNFLTAYDWQKENDHFQFVDITEMGRNLK
jgi:hypothetical protein